MKNFLIAFLALSVVVAAFLTRPDQEEFDRYADGAGGRDVEFKDYFLWTTVQKDGRTLYTGVFDHWIDNEKVKSLLPS